MTRTNYLRLALTKTCSLLLMMSAFGQNSDDINNKFQPVSEDVFNSITQFYDYDREIPLEAKTVAKKETKVVSILPINVTGYISP